MNVKAWIGLDSEIERDGKKVSAYREGNINVLDGYEFCGLTELNLYKIIVLASTKYGYDSTSIKQSTSGIASELDELSIINISQTSMELVQPALLIAGNPLPRTEAYIGMDLQVDTTSDTNLSDNEGRPLINGSIIEGHLDVSASGLVFSDLTPGNTYTVLVLSFNEWGYSSKTWTTSTLSTPDTTAPILVGVNPANAAVDVSVALSQIQISFNEAIDVSSLTSKLSLSPADATLNFASYNANSFTASYTLSGNLQSLTTYTIQLASGVKDSAGNSMAASSTNSFTTIDTSNPLMQGLVAWYPFNGDAKDASGNGNDGTVNGATLTTDRFGYADKAFEFDGDDWIDITNLNLHVYSTGTISAWVNINDIEDVAGNQGNAVLGWTIDNEDRGTINYCGPVSCGHPYAFTTSVKKTSTWYTGTYNNFNEANKWVHVVATFHENSIHIYLNSKISSHSQIGNLGWSQLGGQFNDISIGRYDSGTAQYLCYMNGKIDDIRIYDRALSETEITQLYNEGAKEFQADASTVALWHFNEGSGSTLTDFSGSGNDGTISGASWGSGQSGFGSALNFDGVNDYVDIAGFTIPIAQVEYSTYIKPNVSGSNQTTAAVILGDYTNSGNGGMTIRFGTGGTGPVGNIEIISGSGANNTANDFELDTSWYSITAQYDSQFFKLFIDGQYLAKSNSFTLGTTVKPFEIGRDSHVGDRFFNGLIDETRISNTARSAAEIYNYYRRSQDDTFPGIVTDGLVAWYQLNGASDPGWDSWYE